jgi:hypothetical protein
MPDREPEPWESGAAAPFLWIETPRGNLEVWALGEDRFRITAPGAQQAGQKTAPGVARSPEGLLGSAQPPPLHARLRPYRSRPARSLELA